MKTFTLWEHGHAYQPRRIIDSITNTRRQVSPELCLRIAERTVRGRNWFELMLKPGGVYDLIINGAIGRSIDIEPITLKNLEKINPGVFNELKKLVREGKISLILAPYSHPILPILQEASRFDAEVNVTWSLQFFKETFFVESGHKLIGFWLSECAYTNEVAKMIIKVARKIFGKELRIFFILDEIQAENVKLGKVYRISYDSMDAMVIFRSRSLSDAYAFSSDYDRILNCLQRELESGRMKVLGVVVDAETYGGAYDPLKPGLLLRLHSDLEEGFFFGKDEYRVVIKSVNKMLEASVEAFPIKINDFTAWSDYQDHQIFNFEHPSLDNIIAEKAGSLCRWTGFSGDSGKGSKTYFIVFEWFHPARKKHYIRILSSIWKVAYNAIRSEGADVVRRLVFELLEEMVGSNEIESILLDYGNVVFEKKSIVDFIREHFPQASDKSKKAAELALKAYQYANQDSLISCPTFWQNFDTEVTWTALSYVAGGITLIAQACKELGYDDKVRFLAEKYQELFLDFEWSFQHLVEECDMPLNLFYGQLKNLSKRQGYDVESELSRVDVNPKELAKIVADKLYNESLGKVFDGKPLWNGDVNQFLVLSLIYQKLGRSSESQRFYREAKLFEWKKAIYSVVSRYPIPVRVGIIHAKHFPNFKENLKLPVLPTEAEIETEIIIGEAQAYESREC